MNPSEIASTSAPVASRRALLRGLALGAAGLAAGLLAACGGQAQTAAPTAASGGAAAPAPTAAPGATTAPAAPTAPAAAAKPGATATPDILASVTVKSGTKAIDWWWPWGGMTGLQALKALADDFNKTHNDFQVKPLQVSDERQKLLAAIAGQTAPSVETGGTGVDFWLQGGAMPLDSYLGTSKVINVGDLFDTNLVGGKIEGKTYGIPAVEAYLRWAMCFNKDLLTQHNLSTTDLPTDYDTLYQWAKEMTVTGSSGAVKVLGFDPLDAEGAVWGNDPYYWGAAQNYKYYDKSKQQYAIDADPMVETVTLIQKFVDIVGAEKRGGFAKSYGTWTESPTAMMPTGVEGFNINGYWAPGELVKSAPGKSFVYGWVPVPTSRKGTKLACTGGHYAILPKGSPQPELGFQLIEYLETETAMNIIFDATGWLGASKSFLKKVDTSKYPGLEFYVKQPDQATSMWGPFFEPIPSFASDQFYKAVDQVTYHKLTPKDAMVQVQQAVQTELKNQFPNGVKVKG